jgi:hypothetical protein
LRRKNDLRLRRLRKPMKSQTKPKHLMARQKRPLLPQIGLMRKRLTRIKRSNP